MAEAGRLIAAAFASKQVYRGLAGSDRPCYNATALGTGFRSAELASLAPEAFELVSEVPTVKLEGGARQESQEVIQPLPIGLADALGGYLAGKTPDKLSGKGHGLRRAPR